jgi:hypothetical protein
MGLDESGLNTALISIVADIAESKVKPDNTAKQAQ